MAVGPGVGRVEQLHGPQVHFAALEHEPDPRAEVLVRGEGGGQAFVQEVVHGRVFLAEDGGMVGVGGHALEAEEQRVLEGEDVGVGLGDVLEAVLPALGDQAGEVRGRAEGGRAFGQLGGEAGGQGVALGHGFLDPGLEVRRVEVDVGERGEKRLGEKASRLERHVLARGLGGGGRLAQARQGIDEQILEVRDLGFLAAHAELVATGSLGRLFALVAKHIRVLLAG
ncbi:hypothetical protein DSECCO2_608440 [anaerobic digester metagenome]